MRELLQMSDAEKEIMKTIWDNGGSIFIADLLSQLEQRKKDWKRSTVRTFIARLIEKGLIRTIRHGKMCEYFAAVSEEDYLSGQAANFVDKVFDGNIKSLLVSLFGQESLNSDELKELEGFWSNSRWEEK